MKKDIPVDGVEVYFPAEALIRVFDECDRHDVDETGGRLVGTYVLDSDERLVIHVTGVIESGPKTRRSATSLFQDRKFQADVFRKIEAEHPEVEHLGSWHTHHVNGYPTLSGGDRKTYKRTVNHKKHNTRFFYALLVVNRNDTASLLKRYNIRHFILFRDDPAVYEIPTEAVKILDEPLWWPKSAVSEKQKERTGINIDEPVVKVADRAIDQQFLKEFFPKLRPFFSNEAKAVYWKGTVELIDGTNAAAIIAEVTAGRDATSYAAHLKAVREELVESIEELKKQRFNSGREAAFTIQRVLDKRLYETASAADKESSLILNQGESKMNVLTIYVGQGALAAVHHLDEAVIIDSFMPASDEELTSRIQSQLNTFTKGKRVVGLMLTGFDDDHAHPDGVDFILSSYQPDWIMYPRYYHDTDNAASVFDVIKKHESLRKNTNHPLKKLSVRLDKLDQRVFRYLATSFEFELFSPHIEDMDSSNNCSLVLKITGLGTRGFSYLVTGDTETERWDTINRLFGGALKSNIMAAPHHGSKSGCNPETVVLVSPNSVLISAGVDNQYGHPHSEAVAVYRRVAQHVFSTNSDGGQSLLTRRRADDFETTAMAQE